MSNILIDKIAWLHIKDKKLLVTRSHGKDTWYNPGGKREEGETDIQTLVREIKEELNVDIKEETAKLYGIFEAQAHGRPEGTIVRMICYTAEYEGELQPSQEIAELDFFTTADVEKTAPVDHLIFADLRKKGLID